MVAKLKLKGLDIGYLQRWSRTRIAQWLILRPVTPGINQSYWAAPPTISKFWVRASGGTLEAGGNLDFQVTSQDLTKLPPGSCIVTSRGNHIRTLLENGHLRTGASGGNFVKTLRYLWAPNLVPI